MPADEMLKSLQLTQYRHAKKLVSADRTQAMAEFEALAKTGHVPSMKQLGRAHAVGSPPNDADAAQAEKWFKAASDAGDIHGHFLLGRLYLRLKRYREARETYAIPAAAGYGPALHDLGKIYLLGLGVEKNVEKAINYFERAADAGSVFAKGRLGRVLMKESPQLKFKLKGCAIFLSALLQLFVVLFKDGFESSRLIE